MIDVQYMVANSGKKRMKLTRVNRLPEVGTKIAFRPPNVEDPAYQIEPIDSEYLDTFWVVDDVWSLNWFDHDGEFHEFAYIWLKGWYHDNITWAERTKLINESLELKAERQLEKQLAASS